ncbi:MAG TPA: HEAT repeat domain-containing protein [Planctomycetota bacterium]
MNERRILAGVIALLAIGGVWQLLDRRALLGERERLEKELARERRRAPAPAPEPTPQPESPALSPEPARPPEPERRPAAPRSREEALKAFEDALEAVRQFPDPDEPAPAPKQPPDIPSLQAQALNPTLSARLRVDALAKLRSAGDGARSPAVVNSMVQLLQDSGDDRIRVDICRHMKGVESDFLKRQLLISVRSDPTSKVREEAAESLGPMTEDPLVRQALEEVAQRDASDKVQEQARRALRERR